MHPTRLLGLLFRISSDPSQSRRSDQFVFHYVVQCILLYSNALQTQKCRGRGVYKNVSTANLGAYTDDVVVKQLIYDLAETFDNLRKFIMKLNSQKCTFGIASGKLVGYMVSRRGIYPNLEKVSAITSMMPPERLHDMQKLTGCVDALSRFISRLDVRGLAFFKLLKKQDKFQWTKEVHEAFEYLKRYLTTPPILVAREPHKLL
jgi:hypothetical protein